MIRRAKEEDINDILTLLHEVHDIHEAIRPDLFKKNTTKYSSNDLLSILKDDKKPIFVYVNQNKVIAYAFCVLISIVNDNNFKDFKYLFVDDLCVESKSRSQGVGSELYNYAKDYARSKKCDFIRLNVWKLNEKAYDFYIKNGMDILEYVMEEKL